MFERLFNKIRGRLRFYITWLLDGGDAEGFGAIRARTDVAKMIVAVDAGGMAIGELELNGVAADLGRRLCTRLRLEHG